MRLLFVRLDAEDQHAVSVRRRCDCAVALQNRQSLHCKASKAKRTASLLRDTPLVKFSNNESFGCIEMVPPLATGVTPLKLVNNAAIASVASKRVQEQDTRCERRPVVGTGSGGGAV